MHYLDLIDPSQVLFTSPLKPRICFPFWPQDFTIENPKLSRLRPSMHPGDVPGRLLPSAFYLKQVAMRDGEMTLD